MFFFPSASYEAKRIYTEHCHPPSVQALHVQIERTEVLGGRCICVNMFRHFLISQYSPQIP